MQEVNMSQFMENVNLSFLKQIHVALPARVLKFNENDNTVQVELMINEITRDGKTIVIPPLDDVPVQFFRGGEFVITTPISIGDNGLCVFSDSCIDDWFAKTIKSIPLDNRLHDYSDGFFFSGFSPKLEAIKDVDLDGVCMRTLDKSTYIKLTNGVIKIKGDIQHDGNTNMSGIITTKDVIGSGISLKGHTHTGDSGGNTSTPK